MTESTRTSALASRHRALGSVLEDWNGMGTAWTYHSDPEREHDAVREAAGLFDMSPLKKVWVRGPDATRVLDHAMTRDMQRVAPGSSVYSAVLSDRGTVSDDAIAANWGPDGWLYCHGSGESMARLLESAEGRDVDIELDDDLHNLALQGPAALNLLNQVCDQELGDLPYFQHRTATLFGNPVRISRTGYSGERGYEIFAGSNAVCDVWDGLLAEGENSGVVPASFTALDKVRIEAGLLFYGYDMTEEHYPFEVGLGFTVNQDKPAFRGKEGALGARGKERFCQAGLVVDAPEALAGAETLHSKGEEVGIVNSPAWSHRTQQSLALAHIRPDKKAPGTRIEVQGGGVNTTATVTKLPFHDPGKRLTHA